MDYKVLGRNIAKARTRNYLTQENLAEKVDVSTVFISQIETAVRKPSLETLYKISVALNTTMDVLIRGYSEQNGYEEIATIIKGKNQDEIRYISNVLRELCNGIEDGKVI
ncbi:MAG: helix-turn-helix transcriptional regulator [Clostridia bacterium]|nr:helix-turn-helix transcriptional regulator [Clostridia bacterium]